MKFIECGIKQELMTMSQINEDIYSQIASTMESINDTLEELDIMRDKVRSMEELAKEIDELNRNDGGY